MTGVAVSFDHSPAHLTLLIAKIASDFSLSIHREISRPVGFYSYSICYFQRFFFRNELHYGDTYFCSIDCARRRRLQLVDRNDYAHFCI